ncbi:hypothetical protein MBLNU13_g04544t3 [Cladosporium sp. NU13]
MASLSDDTRDLSSTLLNATVILTTIGAVFVLARLWVRFFSTKAHSWDDYFIAGSLVGRSMTYKVLRSGFKFRTARLAAERPAASFASMALTIVMVDYGYGKTKALLEPSQMTKALKYSNFAVLINGFAMAFLKISIGLSLLRLQLGKGMVWIVWGSIFLSVVVNGLVVVTTLFGCRPLAAAWDRSLMPVATCLPRTVTVAHSYTQTVGNIITDLFYSLSPLYYLSNVKVSVYNKWALRGVFMIGLLATVCAIAKCTELPRLGSTTNPTYDGAGITIWVRAELNAGLVAAAIPPLKSLFENILRNVFGVRSQLRTHTNGYPTPRTGNTRRSCDRDLEDDEIAMRSHAAYLHSGNEFQLHHHSDRESTDGSAFEDQQRKTDSEDNKGEYGGHHHGPITKTISYTIRHDQPHKGA